MTTPRRFAAAFEWGIRSGSIDFSEPESCPTSACRGPSRAWAGETSSTASSPGSTGPGSSNPTAPSPGSSRRIRSTSRVPPGRCPRVFDLGCIVYAAVPTAPPWWASAEGYTDEKVRRIMQEVGEEEWGRAWPVLYETLGGNPWAAMPSLHFATSLMAALLLSEAGPAAGRPRLGIRGRAGLRPGLPRGALRGRPAGRRRHRDRGPARRALCRAGRAGAEPSACSAWSASRTRVDSRQRSGRAVCEHLGREGGAPAKRFGAA